jgi:hypothetical protein
MAFAVSLCYCRVAAVCVLQVREDRDVGRPDARPLSRLRLSLAPHTLKRSLALHPHALQKQQHAAAEKRPGAFVRPPTHPSRLLSEKPRESLLPLRSPSSPSQLRSCTRSHARPFPFALGMASSAVPLAPRRRLLASSPSFDYTVLASSELSDET